MDRLTKTWSRKADVAFCEGLRMPGPMMVADVGIAGHRSTIVLYSH